MQTLKIDFAKEPDIQNLVTDKQMGERIILVGTIAAKDDQSVDVTIEHATDDPAEVPGLMADEENAGESGAGDEAEPADNADTGSPNTPGGSMMQDMMAAEGPKT